MVLVCTLERQMWHVRLVHVDCIIQYVLHSACHILSNKNAAAVAICFLHFRITGTFSDMIPFTSVLFLPR